MRINEQHRISFVVTVLLIVAWCAVILLLGNIDTLDIYGWLSFLYVPVCLTLVFFCSVIYKPIRNDSSVVGLPIHYSLLFLILAVLINAGFIFSGVKPAGPFVIAADVLLLVVYLLIALFSYAYLRKLPGKMKKAEQNTTFSVYVSKEIGSMLAQVDDTVLHKELKHLKEEVDYSTNTTQRTIDETVIVKKLEELKAAISKKDSSEKISDLISETASLWKARNAKL